MIRVAYILAGGQSKRFGSDKALAVIQGKTLLQHTLDLAQTTHDQVYLSTDRLDRYPEYQLPCVIDQKVHLGPMNGILQCLKHAFQACGSHTKIMFFPCDLWRLTTEHVEHLQSQTTLRPACKAWLYRDEFPQVTYAIYSTRCIPQLELALNEEQLSMTRWVRAHTEECHFETLPEHLPKPVSINTPDDLKAILD